MFQYKFFVHSNGTVRVRISNNGRKTEMSLQRKATPQELEGAMRIGSRCALATYLAKVTSCIEAVAYALVEERNQGADVAEIRPRLEEALGIPSKKRPKNSFRDTFWAFVDLIPLRARNASTRKLCAE